MGEKLAELIVLIRGGGEVASGIAHRLYRSHFRVCLTETEHPLAVSRGTSFSEAVFDKVKTIEGVTAEFVPASLKKIHDTWQQGNLPLVIDPPASIKDQIKPDVLVDAVMAKRNTGTRITDAPLVIGLGTGFYAGKDVHLVVETNNSNNLGRVIVIGEAEANTGIPVSIGGMTIERVLWAPEAGVFNSDREIGESVAAGEPVGRIGELTLVAPASGILRGLLRSGVSVAAGAKLIEVDPLNDKEVCFFIRDKMRAIAGGVLEAIMARFNAGEPYNRIRGKSHAV